MFENRLMNIQSQLHHLVKHKNELELQLNILKAQNNELNTKVFQLEEDHLCWPDKK